jgi:hypothetical protein
MLLLILFSFKAIEMNSDCWRTSLPAIERLENSATQANLVLKYFFFLSKLHSDQF